MSSFLQLLVSGLATGAIYALVAVGFSLLWQASQTINFAQGEFVMLPAFFVLVAMHGLGLPYPLAVLVGIVAAAVVLGILFRQLIVNPMIEHGLLPLVVSTIALSIFLREAVKDFYSAQAQPFPSMVADRDIDLFGSVFSLQSIVVLGVGVSVAAGLHVFLNHSQLGRMMQASAQNRTVALILGIDVAIIALHHLVRVILVVVGAQIVFKAHKDWRRPT